MEGRSRPVPVTLELVGFDVLSVSNTDRNYVLTDLHHAPPKSVGTSATGSPSPAMPQCHGLDTVTSKSGCVYTT